METQFDINKIFVQGEILNELELERALVAHRQLRLLGKTDSKHKSNWRKLGELIRAYEKQNWNSDSRISEKKIKESELAEEIAEKERSFIKNRKELIKSKLKKVGINQQQLGTILGHRSKTYMSELMNGISPFTLKDLIIINRLLKIDLTDLIPTFLPHTDRLKIRSKIEKLDNPKIKLSSNDFELIAG